MHLEHVGDAIQMMLPSRLTIEDGFEHKSDEM
jgi:hypothetical protein